MVKKIKIVCFCVFFSLMYSQNLHADGHKSPHEKIMQSYKKYSKNIRKSDNVNDIIKNAEAIIKQAKKLDAAMPWDNIKDYEGIKPALIGKKDHFLLLNQELIDSANNIIKVSNDNPDGIKSAIKTFAKTCGSCHKLYRN